MERRIRYFVFLLCFFVIPVIVLSFNMYSTSSVQFETVRNLENELKDKPTFTVTCKNTLQGSKWITDDRGHFCSRQDLNPFTGCCQNGSLYYCDSDICLKEFSCCNLFEVCVSCCLGENDTKPLKDLSDIISRQSYSRHTKITSTFGFCTNQCRTSSRSVVHQNTFRSQWKYCYGLREPPLIIGEGVYTEVHANT
eukprot:TRINITY_DN17166_c0_g1_i1.p1 TRINITY_DN17166_c0_g1~~TRINITY_DN17166_c0_g1_i1.p1  ORF type:complete len:195 (-),score=13.78 TRINITY_DN17166_c0_g1_i1:283-867(-)